MLDVRDFGAKGDGIVDDTAAIQTAIDSGKEVLIPYGIYLITKNLLLKSDLTICGEGTLKVNTDASIPLSQNIIVLTTGIDNPPLKNIRISGITIDGGGQTGGNITAGYRGAFGIYLSNVSDVVIDKICGRNCGRMNTTDPEADAGYGGIGIFAECRHGQISNIKIINCTIHNIAGGGINAGDGIVIAGYNTVLSIRPYDILIANCTISIVGRNGISLAGDVPYSFGKSTRVINNHISQAQLSGIDVEDGSDMILSENHLVNCGNIDHYFSYGDIFPPDYRLRAAIATGELSDNITISNSIIENCNIGITYGVLLNKIINVRISGSDYSDITRGLANAGDLVITDSQFMSRKTCFNYESPYKHNVQISKCLFRGAFKIIILHAANITNCYFDIDDNESGIIINNPGSGNLSFNGCNFSGTGIGGTGMNITGGPNLQISDCMVSHCRFNDLDDGIIVHYRNIVQWQVMDSIFQNIALHCIRHENALDDVNGKPAFNNISRNKFLDSDEAISINQSSSEISIHENYFKNINKCIGIENIYTPGIFDITISHNLAISCTNGIIISNASGSWDRCIVTYNNMYGCSGIKTSFIAGGNANGFVSNNIT